MPHPQSIVLADTMAIKVAHDLGCWNALCRTFRLHSVMECVEEATRMKKGGSVLVRRTKAELAAELTLGVVNRQMTTALKLRVGNQVDIHEGETHLLAYALTLPPGTWFLCGPDNGTVRAMQMLSIFDRMVSLESLANTAGHQLKSLQHHFSERWLSDRRTQFWLQRTG